VRAADGAADTTIVADFERAMAVAHKQGAKAWRTRAAVGLFKLLEAGGRYDEAHALLKTVLAELDPSRAPFETNELDALLLQAR
jgi:hypothetical protein